MKYDDYTEHELALYNMMHENVRHTKVWGMDRNGKTYWIPYQCLKLNHLRNIIVHIETNKQAYADSTLEDMKALLKIRLQVETEAGKVLYGQV